VSGTGCGLHMSNSAATGMVLSIAAMLYRSLVA
jgi:hypothetical protein